MLTLHSKPSLSICGHVIREMSSSCCFALIRLVLRRSVRTRTDQHTPLRLHSPVSGDLFSLGVWDITCSVITACV